MIELGSVKLYIFWTNHMLLYFTSITDFYYEDINLFYSFNSTIISFTSFILISVFYKHNIHTSFYININLFNTFDLNLPTLFLPLKPYYWPMAYIHELTKSLVHNKSSIAPCYQRLDRIPTLSPICHIVFIVLAGVLLHAVSTWTGVMSVPVFTGMAIIWRTFPVTRLVLGWWRVRNTSTTWAIFMFTWLGWFMTVFTTDTSFWRRVFVVYIVIFVFLRFSNGWTAAMMLTFLWSWTEGMTSGGPEIYTWK